MPHNAHEWMILLVGLTAQLFFTARTLLQWLKSEAARKTVSPVSYWIFSVAGACLMFVYGVLRNDFSIILGQFISYYIYLWNLEANGVWKKLHRITRIVLPALPLVAAALLLKDAAEYSQSFFHNSEIPVWLVIFGSSGQVMFTLRFIYQFIFSHRRHVSVLPRGFWVISLTGSCLIIAYGIIRLDFVLILGQSFGLVSYIRNLILGSDKKNSPDEK